VALQARDSIVHFYAHILSVGIKTAEPPAGIPKDTYANHMLIKIGYDIALRLPFPTAVVYLLRVHPSRKGDLVGYEEFRIEPELSIEEYFDGFGNHCGRLNCTAGVIRFLNHAIIRDPGVLDSYVPDASQHDVRELPLETLSFVLPSRYCEVDSELLNFAWQTFGPTPAGWAQVQAICDFVHGHLRFDYLKARANRTALDGFRERVGVCRDFTHLAITLCRCMNIPARYATGYLGELIREGTRSGLEAPEAERENQTLDGSITSWWLIAAWKLVSLPG
jgi:transglutaminase-like putative cysteine protease